VSAAGSPLAGARAGAGVAGRACGGALLLLFAPPAFFDDIEPRRYRIPRPPGSAPSDAGSEGSRRRMDTAARSSPHPLQLVAAGGLSAVAGALEDRAGLRLVARHAEALLMILREIGARGRAPLPSIAGPFEEQAPSRRIARDADPQPVGVGQLATARVVAAVA